MADSFKNIKKRAERPAFLSTAPDFSNDISPKTCQYIFKSGTDTGKVTANTKAPMGATAPGISS
jgi:hypothetical protein